MRNWVVSALRPTLQQHRSDGGQDSDPAQQARSNAKATLADIREETRTRYEKLRKQIAYAEEFLDLVNTLAP